MYHGAPAERAELRRTKMKWDRDHSSSGKKATSLPTAPSKRGRKKSTNLGKTSTRHPKRHASHSKESSRRSTRLKNAESSSRSKRFEIPSDDDSEDDGEKPYIPSDDDDDDDIGKDEDVSEIDTLALEDEIQQPTDSQATKNTFPIIITTYEMIIKDRQHLSKYEWNFIVVDEGHRLKNMDCKCAALLIHPANDICLIPSRLMQEIKKYDSANRLILTGTPLHVRDSLLRIYTTDTPSH